MAIGMSILQSFLRKEGLSRIGASLWLKCHLLSVECMVVARRYLEMLNLNLYYMSTGLSITIVSHRRCPQLLSKEWLAAVRMSTEIQIAHL
jgi:hypothetical protein